MNRSSEVALSEKFCLYALQLLREEEADGHALPCSLAEAPCEPHQCFLPPFSSCCSSFSTAWVRPETPEKERRGAFLIKFNIRKCILWRPDVSCSVYRLPTNPHFMVEASSSTWETPDHEVGARESPSGFQVGRCQVSSTAWPGLAHQAGGVPRARGHSHRCSGRAFVACSEQGT